MSADLVCIVDDNDSVRKSLASLLASNGHASVGFASGAELLATTDVLARIGCLVLDVRMPGMTGPQLQRELLARDLHIPVIFISATADPVVREQALADGALGYLLKPYAGDRLLSLVGEALGPDRPAKSSGTDTNG